MTSPTLPKVYTEIGVTPAAPVVPAGTLNLDDPALGLLDTGTLCAATAWTDAGPFARTISVVRPGTRAQGPLFTSQSGSVTVLFDNRDGRFDSDNLAGPYVAAGVSQIRAMIPFRVRANWNNTDYFVWTGYAGSWQDGGAVYDQGYSEVTLTGSDAFKIFAGITLAAIVSTGAGELSGARIARILNSASWATGLRRIDTGDSAVQATTYGTDALSLLQLTADTELGAFYMGAAGNVVFRHRQAILKDARSATVQGVFGDVPGQSHPAGTELACAMPARANDDTVLFNDIQITAAGSANLQESQDAGSVATYLFPRTYARTDLIMTTDAEALQYANWVRTVARNPEDRVDTLLIDPIADPVGLFPQILARDIGDRIQVWRRPQSTPDVVTLYGTNFPAVLANQVVSSTGHTFQATAVPGWGFGAGEAAFYTAPLPGGNIAITTVPLTENELQPTADHAEIGIFVPAPLNPSAAGPLPSFYRIIIPTSTGALTAVEPGNAIGGTDAGGGDMQILGGRPVFSCTGYYFNWNIPTFGLYPALGFLTNLAGTWTFSPYGVNFLTGDNAGFEGGTTGNWTGDTNCAVANSVLQAHSGTHSMSITSAAAGDMIAGSCTAASILTQGMAVLPGQEVLVAAWVRSALNARNCSAGIAWYDVTGTIIGSPAFGADALDSNTAWTQVSAALTAPALAVWCRALVKAKSTAAASEVHFADDIVLQPLGGSLTGDQWELTNPVAFTTIDPAGISSGTGASYWSPRSPGQMQVLPNSGRLVVGHYFGTGSFTGGAISVCDANGAMLAAYQLPNIVPTDGTTLTTCAVRDVEADPSSAVNDERFVVIYDCFGTGNIQVCFQEFSYNESAKTIAPVSLPVCPTDTESSGAPRVRPEYAFFGSDGTLYIICGSGLAAANMSVYIKHGGGRNNVVNAPVVGGWQTTSWPTPVQPDYSLGFPVAYGLGALSGPIAIDPGTGAVLVPGATGKVAAAVPDASITALGANLLTAVQSGFETPNLLTDDDNRFASTIGTWVASFGTLTRNAAPPVAPPQGIAAGQAASFSGALVMNSGFYNVTAGLSYQFTTYFLTASVVRTCECYIQWQNNVGGVISTSAHGTGADNAATWTLVTTGPVTAPAGAARAVLFVQADSPTGTGEVHYFAANSLWCLDASSVTGWTGFLTNLALTQDQALDGSFSLSITSGFTNETDVAISPKLLVVPGREYLAKAWFRGKTTAEACKLSVVFQDNNGSQIGFATDGTLKITDSTSAWTEAWCGALAPAGAVTAQIQLQPFHALANSVHYADRVSFQAQPWTVPPAADIGSTTLRSLGFTVNSGRPTVTGGYLYVPLACTFTPAETAVYSTSYVPDTLHPQFLAAVNIAQLLAGNYGAVVKDCFIRGIQHDVDAVAGTWLTTWTLQDASRYAGFLVLDSLRDGRIGTGTLAY